MLSHPVQPVAESINNRNVISGFWDDPSGALHGFIAYPNVVLPVGSQNGAFVFDVAVSPNTPVHLDPAVAVGYQYAVGDGNPLFASVNLPIGIGDNLYTLIVQRHAFTLPAGQRFDFAGNGFADGVSAFEVLGIETSAGLDPANPRAFVTEVTFAAGGNGRFTGTMKPMTPGDELADLRDMVTEVGPGKSLASKMTTAETAYAAGSVPDTCAALADLISEVAAVSGKKLSTTFAGAITAEANAARAAVGCP